MTLEEAKQEYLKYHCSTFEMFHNGGKYGEFKELKVAKSILAEWSQEMFDRTYEEFKKTKSSDLLLDIILDMEGYSERNRNRKNLLIMKEALE